MDLKELSLVNPETHWYYQSKLNAILRLIESIPIKPNSIVEVGAGSAFFGKEVRSKLHGVPLTCVDTNYDISRNELDGVIYQTSSSNCVADLYLFIDVLEHVNDDKGVLLQYFDIAPEGSIFIITVPAFMSLWSGHDEYLEHVKRYRVQELEHLGSELGVLILKKGYLFSLIFPIAWFARKFVIGSKHESSMRTLPKFLNAILRTITSIEHRMIRNQFFGLSAVIMFQKI
jgi:hypothetical protein